MIDCIIYQRELIGGSRKRIFINPDAIVALEMQSAEELHIRKEHLQDPGEKFCVVRLVNDEFIACHDDEQLAEAIVLSKQNKTITTPDSP